MIKETQKEQELSALICQIFSLSGIHPKEGIYVTVKLTAAQIAQAYDFGVLTKSPDEFIDDICLLMKEIVGLMSNQTKNNQTD